MSDHIYRDIPPECPTIVPAILVALAPDPAHASQALALPRRARLCGGTVQRTNHVKRDDDQTLPLLLPTRISVKTDIVQHTSRTSLKREEVPFFQLGEEIFPPLAVDTYVVTGDAETSLQHNAACVYRPVRVFHDFLVHLHEFVLAWCLYISVSRLLRRVDLHRELRGGNPFAPHPDARIYLGFHTAEISVTIRAPSRSSARRWAGDGAIVNVYPVIHCWFRMRTLWDLSASAAARMTSRFCRVRSRPLSWRSAISSSFHSSAARLRFTAFFAAFCSSPV